uniref:Uncharacterized protein n=1 Tax=Triticum urartu TaxID=4572 RepID=A0A8R7TL12_TRIUA
MFSSIRPISSTNSIRRSPPPCAPVPNPSRHCRKRTAPSWTPARLRRPWRSSLTPPARSRASPRPSAWSHAPTHVAAHTRPSGPPTPLSPPSRLTTTPAAATPVPVHPRPCLWSAFGVEDLGFEYVREEEQDKIDKCLLYCYFRDARL